MDLYIKLNEGYSLQNAALEVQALNEAMGPLLVNGPIPCNPSSELPEGFLGDVNTPPNEFGYVTVRIANYRKLIIPPGISPASFSFVLGDPVEDTEAGQVAPGEIL